MTTDQLSELEARLEASGVEDIWTHEITDLISTIRSLQHRVREAERALRVYDQCRASSYWAAYPELMAPPSPEEQI